MRVIKAAWLTAALMILCSCAASREDQSAAAGMAANGGGTTAASAGERAELLSGVVTPPPQLRRTPAFSASDGHALGAYYASFLPYQNVSAQGDTAIFSPQNADGLNGCAFATYRFWLKHSGARRPILLDWDSSPVQGSLFLGLANTASQRWDWLALPYAGLSGPLDLTPYIDEDGYLLLMVLVSAGPPATLHQLQLQPALAPEVSLKATDGGGALPLSEKFDAGKTADPDGFIADYEWDLDGDGTFNELPEELAARGQSTATMSYRIPADYHPKLRVTDNEGLSSSASLTIEASPWRTHIVDPSTDETYITSTCGIADRAAILYATHDFAYENFALRLASTGQQQPFRTEDWQLTDLTQVLRDSGYWSADTLLLSLSLAEVQGRPAAALSFRTNNDLSTWLAYLYTDSDQWQDAQTWHALGLGKAWENSSCKLLEVNGHPAIASYGPSQQSSSWSELRYWLAGGNGSLGSDWNMLRLDGACQGQLPGDYGPAGINVDMLLVGDRPAICYFDYQNEARYRRSQSYSGAAADDWSEVVDLPAGGSSVSALSTFGGPGLLCSDYSGFRYGASSSLYGTHGTLWKFQDQPFGGASLGHFAYQVASSNLQNLAFYQSDKGLSFGLIGYINKSEIPDWDAPIAARCRGLSSGALINAHVFIAYGGYSESPGLHCAMYLK